MFQTSIMRISGLIMFAFSILGLNACSSTLREGEEYTVGFRWNSEDVLVDCGRNEIRPLRLIEEVYPKMLTYLDEQGVLKGSADIDLHSPSAVGYKLYQGRHLLRYDFAIPLPTAPDFFDGGVTVTIDACSSEFVSAALLGW